MAGTRAGGLKAAAKIKAKYGEDFYKNTGRKGGQNGHTGGFAANNDLAREAGRVGGQHSRRGWVAVERTDKFVIWRKKVTGELDVQLIN